MNVASIQYKPFQPLKLAIHSRIWFKYANGTGDLTVPFTAYRDRAYMCRMRFRST